MKDAMMPPVSYPEWHYQKDGRECGPVTREELHELAAEGHIQPSVRVRRSDLGDWLPLDDVVDLDDRPSPVPVLPADGPIPVGYARPLPVLYGAKYAGFWIRVGAMFLDGLLFVLVVNGAEFIASFFGVGPRAFDDFGPIFILVMWLYFALLESSSRQGTLGKLAFGLRVTDLRGQRLTFGRATGRFFAKYLSILPFYIGFFAIAFTEKNQGFHDQIAGTLVLRNEERDPSVDPSDRNDAFCTSSNYVDSCDS